LRPVVVNARLLALRHGVAARSTLDRLEGVLALHVGGASDLAAAVAIHKRILDLILRAQLADIAAGRPASNRVPLQLIEERGGQSRLKADLRLAGLLDDLALDQLAEHSLQR
jgi:signal-transduction protein with cAMP-binding, CBS, and nucleotidyltransferase domain